VNPFSHRFWVVPILAAVCLVAACGCLPAVRGDAQPMNADAPMSVRQTSFGQLPDGRPVDLFTLTDGAGLRVQVINYGATLISVEAPDRRGRSADVTLGPSTPDGWLANRGSFGATIGRYGNRIAKGRFTLDGHEVALTLNAGENHIHGGEEGFSGKLWSAATVEMPGTVGVLFTYVSPDGEEGYPGTLQASVLYTLNRHHELAIDMTATTDKPTVANLVNHVYWNLGGPGTPDCLGHVLQLEADQYTAAGPDRIPTGALLPVRGTPFDFTTPTPIGARITETDGGYDHNYVLLGQTSNIRLAARIVEPTSGRVMQLYTNQPGMQLFSMNFGGGMPGKGGATYARHAGFCLETQRFPDSPNHPNFPSAVLRPGQTYRHVMLFQFSTE
jgi:aldose 1-epimerase